MTPCNACDNDKCGSCVADSLQNRGYIRDANDHCGCTENGHKNNKTVTNRPKVKTMFTKTKEKDEYVTREVITEEEEDPMEVERD